MSEELFCNDIHSKLNSTRIAAIHRPRSTREVAAILTDPNLANIQVSICGARHAMGGQQFGRDTILIDVLKLDEIGPVGETIEVGAGVMWSPLVNELHRQQPGVVEPWTIRQKQTGADGLTIGGSLSANIHGRGLVMKPIIDDIDAFTLVKADGEVVRCSRVENLELFHIAIGGYGCFGVITSVCLRLTKRRKLVRTVELIALDRVMPLFDERIANGYRFGDFQFAIDENSPDFLKFGVFSCYGPVSSDAQMPEHQPEFGAAAWGELIHLAHTNRSKCFDVYANYYLRTNGALYWSDSHQMSVYLENYHSILDQKLGAACPGSEMISELYVPRANLTEFMEQAAAELRSRKSTVIYGTVRLVEKDRESFLAWARENYACIIFNLHTDNCQEGLEKSADAFRALIDIAISLGGSYYLTYHRWATPEQLLRAYPQFPEFLQLKAKYDPHERFQSEWWRHYRALVAI